MATRIEPSDTPEKLAQRLLGDARMAHELVIPGWNGKDALPIGKMAYLKSERMGPPTRNWTKVR